MSETKFQETLDSFLSWYLERLPVRATEMGVHTWDDKLSNYRAESLQETQSGLQQFLNELTLLDAETLSVQRQIDFTVVSAFVRSLLRDFTDFFTYQRNPELYLGEIYNGIFSLILKDFAPWPKRYGALLSRIKAIPNILTAARENIRPEAVPKIWAEIALEQSQMAPLLFGQILPALGTTPTESAELSTAGVRATDQLNQFASWLKNEVLPQAKGDFAIGSKLFDTLLREDHMVDYDSEKLLSTGWHLFEETKTQINQLAKQIDPGKTAEEIIAESKQRHPTASELLDKVRASMAAAKEFTIEHEIATIPPGETLNVIETPLFLRPIIPIAAYLPPGAFENDLAGVFMVTPPNPDDTPETAELKLRGHNYAKMPVTALHEAYPGHHLQLTRAARSSIAGKLGISLSTLFIEGWAFYCEEMMETTGFIHEPEQRLSRLHDQLWRAARIILDVNLHCKRMSVEDAVAFFVTHCGLEPTHAQAEIKRYTLSPTQPQSYLMGKLEILKVVKEYQRQHPQHSLREMHDNLLSFGSLPPKLLHKALFT